jgi:Flp pilus assembly protein TadG
MAQLRNHLNSFLRRVRNNEKGAVLIELAMVTPVLFTAFAGMFDITLALRARMKVNNLSYNMATMGAVNGRDVDDYQLNDVLDNINNIVAPMTDFHANGKAVFAAVRGTTGTQATILWNRCVGSSAASSVFANAAGSSVDLPDNLDIGAGLTALVASVTYEYRPQFVGSIFPSSAFQLTKTYVHRSRFGEFGPAPRNERNVTLRTC